MEILIPAALLAGFGIIWLLFRPDPERARQIERALLQGARIIDVRAVADFRQRHIQGAESVPLDQLPHTLDPERRVVVYGASAEESTRAAQVLREHGFARVVDAGPMSHWPVPQPG